MQQLNTIPIRYNIENCIKITLNICPWHLNIYFTNYNKYWFVKQIKRKTKSVNSRDKFYVNNSNKIDHLYKFDAFISERKLYYQISVQLYSYLKNILELKQIYMHLSSEHSKKADTDIKVDLTMLKEYLDEWIVIGIAGVTCGGKTTLANKLKELLCPVYVIHQDKYFLPDSSSQHVRCPGMEHNNYDILSALDMEQMWRDIVSTIQGYYIFIFFIIAWQMKINIIGTLLEYSSVQADLQSTGS